MDFENCFYFYDFYFDVFIVVMCWYLQLSGYKKVLNYMKKVDEDREICQLFFLEEVCFFYICQI